MKRPCFKVISDVTAAEQGELISCRALAALDLKLDLKSAVDAVYTHYNYCGAQQQHGCYGLTPW